MPSASVTIDASVLAVPPPNGTAGEAYRYIEALLDWAKLLDKPWIAICMSERSSEVLFDAGLYPLHNPLRQLFSQHGIEEFDVNTVAIVVTRLLMHAPSFETYFRVQDVLMEDVSTAPDVLQLCCGNGLQSNLARCLVLIAILRKHYGEDILDHALILRRSPGRSVHVRALVHAVEHEHDGLDAMLPKPPEYFEGETLVCDNFPGLLACIDEYSVLRNAMDDAGVEIAVRIRLYKSRLERFLQPDWDDVTGMRIGYRFGEAIRRCCRDAPSSVSASALRAASEAIDRQNMPAVHALRTGTGGNDPQRVRQRDNAKAWRRDVDREYHLHYWETGNSIIEFASIGIHNDFTIPE